jgi:excisionase family DNA binding protein
MIRKNDTDVLNAKEAADYLKAHVETLRRMARRGKIPAFKVGKNWRFHRDALRRWSEGQYSDWAGE